ncbi:snRNP protein [Fragilaria crotonensis]|nr:snRNP protein [Fragilaria crotonensis]
MAATLSDWKDKSITVVTCDGRLLVGILVGHDQVQNLILKDAQERIYSEEEDVEIVPLGLYMIRGDNVALVGEADWKEKDSTIRAEPIPAVQQHAV